MEGRTSLSLLILSHMQWGADDNVLWFGVILGQRSYCEQTVCVTHFLTPTYVLSLSFSASASLSACVGVIFHDILFATLYTCVQRRERAEREYVVVLVWEIRERPLRHKEYKVVILPLATSATPTSGALSAIYAAPAAAGVLKVKPLKCNLRRCELLDFNHFY